MPIVLFIVYKYISIQLIEVLFEAIYVLWILQTVSQKLAGGNLHSHGHSHDHSHGHSHGHPHGHPHELYQVTPNSYGGLDTTVNIK